MEKKKKTIKRKKGKKQVSGFFDILKPTTPAYEVFGSTKKQFTKKLIQILGDIEALDTKTDVINKHFKDLDNKTKLKIMAYSEAFRWHNIVVRNG